MRLNGEEKGVARVPLQEWCGAGRKREQERAPQSPTEQPLGLVFMPTLPTHRADGGSPVLPL